jgi:hypothetical protein
VPGTSVSVTTGAFSASTTFTTALDQTSEPSTFSTAPALGIKAAHVANIPAVVVPFAATAIAGADTIGESDVAHKAIMENSLKAFMIFTPIYISI